VTTTQLPTQRTPLAALLQQRADAAATIAAIDGELDRRGVRARAATPGPARSKAGLVLALLSRGEATTAEVRAALAGTGAHAVVQLLHRMARDGEIERVGHGRYRVAETAEERAR
jgi:hypothetical protein